MKKRANLIVVTTLHRADDHRIYHKQITVLSKGFDVSFVCPSDKVPFGFNPKNEKIIIIRSGESKFQRILLLGKIVKHILKQKNSIVLFHDFELILVIFILRLFSPSNAYIYDMHEDYIHQMLISRKASSVVKYFGALFVFFSEIMLLPMFNLLITADDYLKNKYYGMMNGRIVSIFNFPEVTPFVKKYKKSGEKDIVYAGGLYFERGLKEMVSIAEALPYSNLHLYGRTFTKEEESYLRNAISENKNIIYHGYVGYEDLALEMNKMDIGIILLKVNEKFKHNISVKQFDYMLSGLPVIIRKGLVSYVKNRVNGFEVNTAEDAVKVIENLGFDDIEKIGRNGRNLVENKYNWILEGERLFKKIEEISNRIIFSEHR